MSSLKLDHIPLLEGAKNYAEWSKTMRHTLLGEDLWRFIAEGKNVVDLINYGTVKPVIDDKSTADQIAEARTFMVGDAKANSILRRRLAPDVLNNIPAECEDSARATWKHLRATYHRSDPTTRFLLLDQ